MIQLESEQQFDKLKQSNVVFEFTAGGAQIVKSLNQICQF